MENETLKNNIGINNLRDNVFKKIEAGEVSMKPKSYFLLKVAVLIFVVFVTFVISVFLISYILFSVQAAGHMFLLGFGTRGLYEFIVIFPWFLLLVDAFLLLFLDFLLKRFRFGYHSPIIYLFLVTLGIITVFGSIVYRTPLHKDLMYEAEGNHLPFARGMYDGLRKSHRKVGIFRGEIASTSGNIFTIKYDDYDTPGEDEPLEIVAPPGVEVGVLLHVGDKVFVAGDVVDGQFRAYGVHKLIPGE